MKPFLRLQKVDCFCIYIANIYIYTICIYIYVHIYKTIFQVWETFGIVLWVVEWLYWLVMPTQQETSQASSFSIRRKVLGHVMKENVHH